MPLPPRQQIRIVQDAMDARLAQIRDVGIHHLPREAAIPILGVRERVGEHGGLLLRENRIARRRAGAAIGELLRGRALHPIPIAGLGEAKMVKNALHRPPRPPRPRLRARDERQQLRLHLSGKSREFAHV
jgi:hypothetical protein